MPQLQLHSFNRIVGGSEVSPLYKLPYQALIEVSPPPASCAARTSPAPRTFADRLATHISSPPWLSVVLEFSRSATVFSTSCKADVATTQTPTHHPQWRRRGGNTRQPATCCAGPASSPAHPQPCETMMSCAHGAAPHSNSPQSMRRSTCRHR